jgi:SSS family solute:Na+ symporter
LAGTIGLFVFYSAANQVMVQRVLGARSRWDGIMGIIFAGFINFVRPLVTCFLGFIVYHWIHEMHQAEPLETVDQAFAFSLRYLAPEWGLRGIVLAGFIAAVMSTVSALANSTATIFSLDVYKKLIRPDASERAVVSVGRMTSLSALLIAGAVAPQVARFGGIFMYFQQGITFIATPIITVILAGIFSRRVNASGALAGLIAGIITTVVLLGLLIAGVKMPIHWLYVGFFQQVLVLAVIVGATLMTPAPAAEVAEPFFWRPAILTEHVRAEPPRPWYARALLWYALFAAIWFYLYWKFW